MPALPQFNFNLRTSERAFNKLAIEGDKVVKLCFNPTKGRQEVGFYERLPKEIQRYFPTFFGSEDQGHSLTYRISLVEKNDLACIYSRGHMTPSFFEGVLCELEQFFKSCPRIPVSKKIWSEKAIILFSKRLEERWVEYQQMEVLGRLENEFNVNLCVLEAFVKELNESLLRWANTKAQDYLFFAHGDLCFSNILHDGNGSITLVDPRGGVNVDDLYLPQIYDLAKLSQCVFGNYDGILSNVTVDFSEQKQIFVKWLESNFSYSLEEVKLIEAAHLMSLLPLHAQEASLHSKFILAAQNAYAQGKLWR